MLHRVILNRQTQHQLKKNDSNIAGTITLEDWTTARATNLCVMVSVLVSEPLRPGQTDEECHGT